MLCCAETSTLIWSRAGIEVRWGEYSEKEIPLILIGEKHVVFVVKYIPTMITSHRCMQCYQNNKTDTYRQTLRCDTDMTSRRNILYHLYINRTRHRSIWYDGSRCVTKVCGWWCQCLYPWCRRVSCLPLISLRPRCVGRDRCWWRIAEGDESRDHSMHTLFHHCSLHLRVE